MEDDYFYLDDDDSYSEKKFPLALCPCLSTVAYLIPFLSSERPPNVTISPKKFTHYSAMLLKTQIITSHPSQL